ncbi:hypothetical protein GH714_023792 [Hevea brasiliensis]|uniref:Uncharacterized protein n=1 Tax=Hevea brasiliensis TaxID=3981 RepID=A0A6A6KSA4_HEVBR|nr:hypothetical protein GH714_023792 [Hevea brasiliensis]
MLNLEVVAFDMEDLAESLKSITISHNSLVGVVDNIKEDVRETVKIIQGEFHELEGKVNLLIRATSNPIMGSYKVGNTKIPESKAFGVLVMQKRKFDSPTSLDNRPKWGKTSSGGVNKDYSPFEGTKSKSWDFKTRADRPTNLGKEPNDAGPWNDQSPRINNMIMTEPKQLKCYLCDGPHHFTNCPHKGALNVLRAIREEEKGLKGKEQREDDSTPSMVSAIRFLGALKKQKHKPSTEKGLIYVDLWINGKATRALVDTGATDNFIADMTALQFQLNM